MATEGVTTIAQAIVARITDLPENGGVVVTTHLKTTYYKASDAKTRFFIGRDANLYVRRGKRADCLTMLGGTQLLVYVRFGHWEGS